MLWVPDEGDVELSIPYIEEGRTGWLGHRCGCCDAGWALVAHPRGFPAPTVVGMLPWHQSGIYAIERKEG